MSKLFSFAFVVALVAPAALAFQQQEPGHEGRNHPAGQGHVASDKPAVEVQTGPVRQTQVGAERIELLPGLIGQRYELNRTASLPALHAHLESNGFVQNFVVAGGAAQGAHTGGLDSDAQVYAYLEAAALSLVGTKDAALEARLDGLVDTIAAAQKPDGYLNTFVQIGGKNAAWSDLAGGRELESGGRLIEAALAYQRALKKAKLVEVAKKFADHVDATFGPGKKSDPSAHPGIERALAELFDATGEARYLTLAKFFVDARGNVAGRTGYGAIAQDATAVRSGTQFQGDPVRGTSFYAGAADVARFSNDTELFTSIDTIWTDAVTTKTNIVGALGNASARDGITAPFDIGTGTTYDTRSAIGLVEWSQAMLLATGDAKYADMIDRALHNAVLAGTSANGVSYAGVNSMTGAGDFERKQLSASGDFAADITRFVADAPGLIFTTAGNTIYISQYVPCRADFMIGDVKVHLEMQTAWPFGGLVDIKVQADKQVTFSIKFRRPAWCKTVFYQHDLKETEHSSEFPGTTAGWEVYERRYDPMDGCKINFLGPIRRVAPLAEVASDKGRVAISRGPLVYALEGVDNRGSARAMVLPATASLVAANKPDKVLSSIRIFRSRDGRVVESGADGTKSARGSEIVFLPYYQLANRAQSDFVVWVPETPELATVAGSAPR
ncbi:MAG: glycoside hydrolase family 127 protein [Planctomycetota bacterium]|nr:glycoside hydrolase family 127 protein [Planctomycetota bacterium]